MCGIAGEIRFDGLTPDIKQLEQMTKAMAARGPDDSGIVAHGNRAFGHRRLKIMDLSENSQQPMFDSVLGLGIVFNGAIYNYPELRAELETKGYQFFSKGDTEVILKAYHHWGLDCVQKLSGMFAFAIWERESGRTVFARDRLGIKPFYYTKNGHFFRFASTLPALMKSGEIDREIDSIALNYYLNLHAIVPAPRTIFSTVKKLPPATVGILDKSGSYEEYQYWTLKTDTITASYDELQDKLLGELKSAVKRRMLAEVDVGVLLSGGVDSSLLVGLMAEHGTDRLATYSVGFEDVNGEVGNEFKYSDLIARHFRTKHHQIEISNQALLSELPNAIRAMSEPMVSHDCIGFYLLSHEVAKTCKAVQSGQGADEVFGGYSWYPPMMDADNSVAKYREVFFDRSRDEYLNTVNQEYVAEDAVSAFVEEHFGRLGHANGATKALHIDSTVMLVDDPVKRVDNMTMSAGLEARVPFLDHNLVEFAFSIPAEHKIDDGGKKILKDVARRVIPSEVIDRPKGYFPVPALKFLQGDVLDYVRDALNSNAAQQRNLFQASYVERLLANPKEHITPLQGSKLWQLGLLEIWLQEL